MDDETNQALHFELSVSAMLPAVLVEPFRH